MLIAEIVAHPHANTLETCFAKALSAWGFHHSPSMSCSRSHLEGMRTRDMTLTDGHCPDLTALYTVTRETFATVAASPTLVVGSFFIRATAAFIGSSVMLVSSMKFKVNRGMGFYLLHSGRAFGR